MAYACYCWCGIVVVQMGKSMCTGAVPVGQRTGPRGQSRLAVCFLYLLIVLLRHNSQFRFHHTQ